MKKKPITASQMGKLSAEARKKKYKIKDWSAHMKKVRNGKAILVKSVEIQEIPHKPLT